jgi:poly-gamma-glutamate synthase PgsB/CapB
MDNHFVHIFAIFLLIFIWETVKYRVHLGRRRKIRTVINVNGTRGKSSVARLLCFALREAGFKVTAKTTGTIPQLLSVDGEIKEIRRGAYPNINEQTEVIARAVSEGADILVIECMAVEPIYQKVSEEKMLRSDIGIITNVRTDHREVMGADKQQIAEALCSTIPKRKVVFTGEREYFGVIEKNAAKKRSRAIQCRPMGSITDDIMRPFPFLEQRENVALVLDVCGYLGVDEMTALKGMYKTVPDPGILTSVKFERGGKRFEFINAFSANDPDSMAVIWERMSKRFVPGQKNFFVFNSRRDRPYRSVDTARVFSNFPVDVFIITGDGGGLFYGTLLRSGVSASRIRFPGRGRVQKILDACFSEAAGDNFVFCGGNIKGKGLEMFDLLQAAASAKNGEKVL